MTLPGFERVFSFTSTGTAGVLGYTLGREIKARSRILQVAPVERIEVRLSVQFFAGATPSVYTGIYERRSAERVFSLRQAYAETGHRTPIPVDEFEDLADPFADLHRPPFLRHAFRGLEDIARNGNAERKAWARGVVERFTDCDEKRRLLELLKQ